MSWPKGVSRIDKVGAERAAEWNKKSSDSNKGKHKFTHTEEAKAKIGKASKEQQATRTLFERLGGTQEAYDAYCAMRCEVMRRCNDKRLATYHATIDKRWQETPPAEREDARYAHWRKFCLERDENACYLCGIKEEDIPKGKNDAESHLHVHHIRQWHRFEESRFDTNNGISLCHKCHRKEHKLMKEGKTMIAILPSGEPNIIPEIELVNGKRVFSPYHRRKLSEAAIARGFNGHGIKKGNIPWNKGKKTKSPYTRTAEQLLFQRIGRLLLIGLGWKNEGKKAGRKQGSIPWNKGTGKNQREAVLLANEILSGEFVYSEVA